MKFIKTNVKRDSNTVSATGGAVSNNNTTPNISCTLWGLYFNGTNNVTGDLTNVGGIYMSDIINMNDFKISTDAKVNFTGYPMYVFDKTVKANQFIGNTGAFTNIQANSISSIDITNSNEIVTKDLTVTGTAHFFQLMIDKVKSSGGAAIFTPADGFTVGLVLAFDKDYMITESSPVYYRLLWKAEDSKGSIDNMWQVGDLALCKTFNKSTNKYYWAVVIEVGQEEVEDGILLPESHIYNYITIYANPKTQDKDHTDLVMGDGDILPEEGDEISMLGNRNDSNRQSAIYISSYNSMDIGVKAPFIAHYKGINDFSLSTHRKSWWSLDSSTFTGDIKMGTAEIPVQDYINQQISMSTIDLNTYKAYAKDAQGLEMTLLDRSDDPDYPYVGIAVTSKDVSDLSEEDFVWMEKGQAGEDAVVYKLIPLYEYALVQANKDLVISAKYRIVMYEGENYTELSTLPTGFKLQCDLSTVEFTQGYVWLDNSVEYTDQTNVNIRLLKGDSILDSRSFPVTIQASATFEITDDIQALVTDNTGNISKLQVQSDNIDLSVKNISDGLKSTGINIQNGKITLNADNTDITGNLNLYGTFTTGTEEYNSTIKTVDFGDGWRRSGFYSYNSLGGWLEFRVEPQGTSAGTLRLNNGDMYSMLTGEYLTTGFVNTDLIQPKGTDNMIVRDATLTGCDDYCVTAEGNYTIKGKGNQTIICNADRINITFPTKTADGTCIKVITRNNTVYLNNKFTLGAYHHAWCYFIKDKWEVFVTNSHTTI